MPDTQRGPRISGQLPTADFSSLEKEREGAMQIGANKELKAYDEAIEMEVQRNSIDLQSKSNEAFQKLEKQKGYDAGHNYDNIKKVLSEEARNIIGGIKNKDVRDRVEANWNNRLSNFESASREVVARETRSANKKTLEAEMQSNLNDRTSTVSQQAEAIKKSVNDFIKFQGLVEDEEKKDLKDERIK